jgi:hypothetical protein
MTDRGTFVKGLSIDELEELIIRRLQTPAVAIRPVSSAALALLAKMGLDIRQGNMYFPGNSYIRGLENRPDIGPTRDCFYENARKSGLALLELGEIEDLATYNIYVANQNQKNARIAARKFGPSNFKTAFCGTISALHQGPNSPPECLDPQMRLSSAPPELFDLTVVNWDTVTIYQILCGLPKLCPGLERGDISADKVVGPLLFADVESQLHAYLNKNHALREALNSVISTNLDGADIERSIATVIVASKILIEANVRAVISGLPPSVLHRYQELMERNRLKEQPLDVYEGKLLECFHVLVTARADSDDETWNSVWPMLQVSFEDGIFGPVTTEEYKKYRFIERIAALPSRLCTDVSLINYISSIGSYSMDIELAHKLLESYTMLPQKNSGPVLVRLALTTWGYWPRTGSYNTKPEFISIRSIRCLKNLTSEKLADINALMAEEKCDKRQIETYQTLLKYCQDHTEWSEEIGLTPYLLFQFLLNEEFKNDRMGAYSPDKLFALVDALRPYNREEADAYVVKPAIPDVKIK